MLIRKRITATAFTALATLHVAHAQTLDFVEDTTDEVLSVFDAISLAAVTIALVWAGLGMLFTEMRGATALRILFGGALIGAAPQVAQFLVGG